MRSETDILMAYSKGEITSIDAKRMLDIDTYGELMMRVWRADLDQPRPPQAELEAQAAAALPILRAALLPEVPDDDKR
ncbi:MAG: hypothetical protein ACK5X0_08450 [Rhodospirillales bacterium]|jgi:hypothetical protein